MKKWSLVAASTFVLFFAGAQTKKNSPKWQDFGKMKISVYTTADNTHFRLSKTADLKFQAFTHPVEIGPCIFIDPSQAFQSIVGIGGAITDAAAETFAKLPRESQQEFLKAYYDPENGISYSLARTNMNSCDFSSESYTYISDNDKQLKTFSVAHDEQFKIPLLKQAFIASNRNLSLFISPWSPPAWMKDNNDMLHGGKLKDEFKQVRADYFVKFIKGLEASGIPVWGLTVQNEPMAKQRWESCVFTAEDERDFIKQYLGPTLLQNGLENKKIIAWDHNRDLMYQRASVVLKDPVAAKYVWGVGFHLV